MVHAAQRGAKVWTPKTQGGKRQSSKKLLWLAVSPSKIRGISEAMVMVS